MTEGYKARRAAKQAAQKELKSTFTVSNRREHIRTEQIVEDFLNESEIPTCLLESIQPKRLTAIYYGFGLVAAVVRENDGFLVKLANTGLISHKIDVWILDRETEPSDTEIADADDQFCKETMREFYVSDFRALKITLANFGLERGIIFDPSLAGTDIKTTPPLAEGSRDEIIRLVRANQTAVVWVTSKGAIVHIPTQPLSLLAGVDAAFFDQQALTDGPFFEGLEMTNTPQVVVSGVKGLSAVDPEWDGKDLFICSNPECKHTHNSDWNTHDNLWKQSRGQNENEN